MNAIHKLLQNSLLCAAALLAPQARAEFQPCPSQLINPNVAEPSYREEILLSPYTYHYSYSAEHKPVRLLGYVRDLPGGNFCGLSLFSNSFGQPSAYAYVGRSYNNIWPAVPKLYASVSAGILYGYVGAYQHKVPLNYKGFSPAIIPAVGYRFTPQDALELQFLGNSALMFNYARRY